MLNENYSGRRCLPPGISLFSSAPSEFIGDIFSVKSCDISSARKVKGFGLWIMIYDMIKYFIHVALQKPPLTKEIMS
ncbi:transmembrane protein, putative [Medicago truncatula]|uniref:Transmembrane protein, putative n=1 Tax=Medicago truncatula TaxID=3880 RepID=A0A072V990_MEDTR|nr:transmembrane protein, putative [Medicago truncatula]